jgi:protein KRI1
LDLDGDWDPEAHDEKMANIYQIEEDDDGQDGVKPSWDDDIDIDDIIPPYNTSEEKSSKKKKSKKKRESAADQDGVDVDAMDADNPQHNDYQEEEEWDGTEEMRKRKLDEYMDELYGMEFNDMVCKFLYNHTQF